MKKITAFAAAAALLPGLICLPGCGSSQAEKPAEETENIYTFQLNP